MNLIMRTNRFAIWWGLLVVASLSVGVAAFFLLRKEGDEIRENTEQSRLMAREASALARLYHEMAKQSRDMAEYAQQAVTSSLATRARTIADNVDLTMAELKEGLMVGLCALPGALPGQELSAWKDTNAWVDDAFMWSSAQGLSLAKKDKASTGLNSLRDKSGGWLWEKADDDPSKKLAKVDSIAALGKNEKDALGTLMPSSGVKEIAQQAQAARASAPQELSEQTLPSADADSRAASIASLSNRAKQQTALDVFNLELVNSRDVLSRQRQTDQQLNEQIQQRYAQQEDQVNQAEEFLGQSLPRPIVANEPAYQSDNFRANKMNRKQLRSEVRNDVHEASEQKTDDEDVSAAPASELANGWDYRRADGKYAWVAWCRSAANTAFGLRLDDKAVVKSLQTAFPEQLEEGEYFALLDEEEQLVCDVGTPPADGVRLTEAVVPVGEELPGWSLAASVELPLAMVAPPKELPAEKDLPVVFALGKTPGGEWGGYVAVSSVMACILVAALLLGGAVLLMQVRRNSLEAVRKTTFVSNVSHELKTPLTTIRMYGEMLGDGLVKNEEKRKGYLSTIIAESQRLTRLVNNVLDFGRLERGEKTYDLCEVEVGSTVAEMLETQRLRLEGEGLEVEWTDNSDGAIVKLDPDSLEQVLLNLLDNLVKYAADGKYAGVAVSVEDGHVSLEVSDRGPGTPAEHRENVFETFHRVDDSLTANKPGCGIGLGIARKLVDDMGGRIACEPNRPQGVKFRLSFPQVS